MQLKLSPMDKSRKFCVYTDGQKLCPVPDHSLNICQPHIPFLSRDRCSNPKLAQLRIKTQLLTVTVHNANVNNMNPCTIVIIVHGFILSTFTVCTVAIKSFVLNRSYAYYAMLFSFLVVMSLNLFKYFCSGQTLLSLRIFIFWPIFLVLLTFSLNFHYFHLNHYELSFIHFTINCTQSYVFSFNKPSFTSSHCLLHTKYLAHCVLRPSLSFLQCWGKQIIL